MDVFAALAHEDASEQAAVANSRAVEAAKVRVTHQFGAYVKLAKSKDDFVARVDMVAERVVSLAEAVAQEYGASDLDSVVEAATEALHTAGGHKDGCECGFCKNKGKGFGPKKDEESEDEEEYKAEEKESATKTSCNCECGECRDGDHCSSDDCMTKESSYTAPANLRDSIWHQAADTETGDTYDSERVDVAKDTLPTTDKANAGDNKGTSMSAPDVPSKRNPVEQQSVTEGEGYGTYDSGDPNPAQGTRKQIDADKALQPEHNVADHTDTWSGMDGQQKAVTNESINTVSSKWRIVEN